MSATRTQPVGGRAPREQSAQAEPSALDAVLAATERAEVIASDYRHRADDPTLGRLRRAMLLSDTVNALERALTPEIMARLMRLMNTRLGFKTDRGPGTRQPEPYDQATVKRCVIDGLIRGVFPVGNEMNIISGECYVTQEGYTRLVSEVEGLTDLDVAPGVPVAQGGQLCCRVAVRWRVNGVPDSLRGADGSEGRAFPIISYQGSTPDNVMGKAKRKALAAVHFLLTRSAQSQRDAAADAPDPEIVAEQARAELEKRLVAGENQAAAAPSDEQYAAQAPREPGAEG